MNVIYKPCFVLSGVKHSDVLSSYNKGEFNDSTFHIDKLPAAVNLSMAAGESSEDPSFSFKDKSGVIQIIYTTGNKRSGIACFWCRRVPKSEPIGIPIRFEKREETYIFHVEGIDCGFRCMYARLRKKLMLNSMREGSGIYAQATNNAKMMFRLQYPNETLTYAPDWELAEWNGGSLPPDKFDDPSFIFLPSPSIIISPVRIQYTSVKV